MTKYGEEYHASTRKNRAVKIKKRSPLGESRGSFRKARCAYLVFADLFKSCGLNAKAEDIDSLNEIVK